MGEPIGKIAQALGDAVLRDERTYQALADASGVDAAVIHRLANGRTSIKLENAEKLARALGLELALIPAKRKGAKR